MSNIVLPSVESWSSDSIPILDVSEPSQSLSHFHAGDDGEYFYGPDGTWHMEDHFETSGPNRGGFRGGRFYELSDRPLESMLVMDPKPLRFKKVKRLSSVRGLKKRKNALPIQLTARN